MSNSSPFARLSPRSGARRLATLLPPIGLLVGGLTLSHDAAAGGFEIPDHGARAVGRGGAYAVGAKDLTATYYNPATMAKFRGTRFMLSHNSIHQAMTYTRAPLSAGWVDSGGNSLEGTAFSPVSDRQKWFLLGAFGAISSDFGLENATFFASMHGPAASGAHDYRPYASQSFMLTEMEVLSVYFNAGGAWKYHSKKTDRDVFGIGASIGYAMLPVMRYGLVTDSSSLTGTDATNFAPIPDPESTQLETTLVLKDMTGITGNVGFWYRPIDALEIGISGKVIPTIFRPEGTLEVDKETLVTDEVKASMKKITMPVNLRGGLRYVHMKGERELFDIEANVVWENWSQIKSYDLTFDGSVAGQALLPLSLKKNWKDTVSVRLGGDYNVIEDHLTVRAGGFFETGAVQEDYAHLDFPSFNRGGVGLGLTAGIPGAEFSVGYSHVFQATQNVSEASAKTYQQRPLRPCPEYCTDPGADGMAGTPDDIAINGVPANAGIFESSYDIIGVSVDLNFTALIERRRAKRGQSKPAPETEPGAPDPTSAQAPPSGRARHAI